MKPERAVTRWGRALAALALGVGLAGCPFGEGEMEAARVPRFEAPRAAPKVALVLGSGGPRGFAHIGVLKVLDAEHLRPDLVIGSSVGAIVGALYAGGMESAALERLAYEISVGQFFELRMLSGGLASGRAVQDFVNERLDNRPMERLGVAYAAAATRVRDGSLVLFNRGDAGLAARASGASPGQFEPVRIGAETYVDGDEASPVPIRAARRLGARVVIAVDVSAYLKDTPAHAPREWVEKDERRARQIAAEAPEADVMIHPNLGYYAGHTEEYRRRVIAAAERETRAQLPAIRAALAKAGIAVPGAAQASVTARSPEALASR